MMKLLYYLKEFQPVKNNNNNNNNNITAISIIRDFMQYNVLQRDFNLMLRNL